MVESTNPVTVLDESRCWDLLASQSVGRLATAVQGMPEIFPVNFVVDGETVVFRTAEGSKLMELVINEQVCFEVDGWNENRGWSVVVKGLAEVIPSGEEHDRVEALPLRPWVPTVKTNFVRVTATEISGRRFAFGPDPVLEYRSGKRPV
ncbi:MAG: pyridoxamine 5'-phosphate oxidase family protein [Actinobacteria bacterium]|nr:pyridoxamine 5'-phosphate oxidase family protein [Actinomycetota bacterium]